MQNIKLSIITINLNNVNGLKRTIDSVVEQTNKNFEFIVIDGKSTDGSVELIKENEKEFSYFVSENDLGIYNAMNKGILNSNGEYLLFLNSGDWLNNNNVVENLLPLLKTFDVISGDIDIFDKKLILTADISPWWLLPYHFKHVLSGYSSGMPTVIINH